MLPGTPGYRKVLEDGQFQQGINSYMKILHGRIAKLLILANSVVEIISMNYLLQYLLISKVHGL